MQVNCSQTYKNGVKSVRVFTLLGFLAEVALHVPNLWEQTTRFFGGYAARSRGVAAARRVASSDIDTNTIVSLPETKQRPTANWVRLIKKVFELDPLQCPKCGGTMKIKAFITDPKEIARIMANRGVPQQRAPPPLKFQLPIAA